MSDLLTELDRALTRGDYTRPGVRDWWTRHWSTDGQPHKGPVADCPDCTQTGGAA